MSCKTERLIVQRALSRARIRHLTHDYAIFLEGDNSKIRSFIKSFPRERVDFSLKYLSVIVAILSKSFLSRTTLS